MTLKISERRELLLKNLDSAFPGGREFTSSDVVKLSAKPGISNALTANFGQGWGKLPQSVVAIKVGLLFEKIIGRKFGDLSITALGRRGQGVSYYKIGPPPKPELLKFWCVRRTDSDGRMHVDLLKGSDGKPLRENAVSQPETKTLHIVEPGSPEFADRADDPRLRGYIAPQEAERERRDELPKPEPPKVQQTGPPPAKWRQPTKQELAERHTRSQTTFKPTNDGRFPGHPITPRGRFDL